MDGYTILAGLLIFFFLFIYLTWFGFSVKIENEKERTSEIKINPYDNLPFSRKLIDKKNIADTHETQQFYILYSLPNCYLYI